MAAPCRFFAAGNCVKGPSCPFSHAIPSGATGAPSFVPMGRGRGQGPPPAQQHHPRDVAAGLGGLSLNPAAPGFRPDQRSLSSPYSTPHLQASSAPFVPGAQAASARTPHHSFAAVHGRLRGAASYFAGEELTQELLARTEDIERIPEPSEASVPDVDDYHSLLPLDFPAQPSSQVFPYACHVYKAFHTKSGAAVTLRRVANERITDKMAMTCVDQWRKISHPNIISVREVFTTRHFKDSSVVFVSDFYPCAESLASSFLQGNPITEPLLWSFVIQLTAALRAIHAAGLACRVLDPSKVLVQGTNRILLGGVSVLDVMQYNAPQVPAVSALQQMDLEALGRLVVGLACGAPFSQTQLQQSLFFVHKNYSEDVSNLVRYLLAPLLASGPKNLSDLMPIIGARFYTEAETRLRHIDTLESDLRKELHNGRLFRLVYKLMLVGESAGQGATGDHYLLTLFRDYVFHVTNEADQSVSDLAHTVQCLNKLECASPEKVMLVSSDEKNVIIVSYADLHRCLELAYSQLAHRPE
eukprot:m.17145 g.17145  ORF g.17145 m.17145 type:complete len:527 (+) comp7052_c0_seq1:1235-2815(+)